MRNGLLCLAATAAAIGGAGSLPAQPPSPAPVTQPAAERNLADFDFVTAKIEQNYAGWENKVTAANRAELDALTARLRAQAASATDAQLLALLQEWIAFFRDRHMAVRPQAAAGPATPPAAAAASYPSLAWTEASVRSRLQALGSSRQPLEGIWNIADGRYRVGVLRTGPDMFTAVVLTTAVDGWSPGQIKAEIARQPTGSFAMRLRVGDHSEVQLVPELVAQGDVLAVPQWGSWQREWPAPADPDAALRMSPGSALFLRRLSPTTLWLRIPDFNDSRAQPLRELVEGRRAELEATPNLIIDLRDNGGGSDYVYEPLAAMLYTRPVTTVGVELRAAPDNIALRQQVADRIRTNAPDQAARIEAQIALMRQRLGQYIQPNRLPFSISRRDAVLPYPRRVAVLIDGAGSTGEQFLLLARQSHKVTLFGQRNSAGVLDFANVVGMPTPSGRHYLQWATSRTLRLPNDPVDPDGIPPDIRIPESERDPVRFAAAWLDRQVD